MQDILRAYVEEHKDLAVIRGMGWDRTWFSGALQGIVRPLTRLDVDAVVSDRPVVLLSFCGHNILFNTKALEAAGVTKDTDDQNGLIVKDADGTPTGYIKEPAAYFPLVDKIPNYDFTAKAHHDSIKKAFEVFNAKGYTLLCDCHLLEIPYDVLTEMAKNGEFSATPTDEKGMVACWGEDVVRHTYPSKSLIDNGVVCAYGSDFVVNPACGLAGLQVAMTRRHVKMDLTYELYKDVPASMPEECVSLREALQAHTINAAYQVHLENVTGSIEVGKSAELIVLDSDIETTPAEHIEDIQVLETVFKGQTVFKKGS